MIMIDDDRLFLRIESVSGNHPSSDSLSRIRNLSDSPPVVVLHQAPVRDTGFPLAGKIAFEYDQTTIRLGPGLSEHECRRLIRMIQDRYKIPDDQDEPIPVERR
jgi:hypothetical protein